LRAAYIEAPFKAYFTDTEEPGIRHGDEVKIQVKCTGICGSEVSAYRGTHPYRIPPLVSGHEFSGVITELGSDVRGWKKGDRVVAEPQYGCGKCRNCLEGKYNICRDKHVMGASCWSGSFGEFVVVPQRTLVRLPDTVSFEYGALAEPLAVAMHAVRLSGCAPSQTVLVLGSGTIGMSTVLVSQLLGARAILAARRDFYLRQALKMGCSFVINDQDSDLEKEVMNITDGRGADITFVCAADDKMVEKAVRCTKYGGAVSIIAIMKDGGSFPYSSVFTKELTVMEPNMYVHRDFEDIIAAIDDGEIDPGYMISRILPVEEFAQAIDFCDRKPEPSIKTIMMF